MQPYSRFAWLRLPTPLGGRVRFLVLGATLVGLVGAESQCPALTPYEYEAESPSSRVVASSLQRFTVIESGDLENGGADPFPLPLEPQSPLGSLIYAGTVSAAIAAFADHEDFESGDLGTQWATSSSTGSGRIQVTGAYGTARGDFALLMDTRAVGDFNLNEAVWTVDLPGSGEALLAFSHASFSDEANPIPIEYTGSAFGDGVSISEDGVRWHTVLNATGLPFGKWQRFEIDLAEAAAAAGMSLGDGFRIKFQQYDEFPVTTDGRGYDEIEIAIPGTDTDTFAFEVDPGQTISAIVRAAPTLRASVSLSGAGGLLASETAAAPGENVILPLVETADRLGDDGASPRHFELAVSGDDGSSGDYTLEVVLNSIIEEENFGGLSNGDTAFAQDIEASFLPLLRSVDASTSGAQPDRGAVRGSLDLETRTAFAEEDFESGDLGPAWFHFSSSAEGRVQVTGDYGTAEGEYALVMDRSSRGTRTVNQAVWTVDLSGVENAALVFRHVDFNDEEHPLPVEFTGRAHGDGVAISDDGLRWYTVVNATNLPFGVWARAEVDLTKAAAAAGMTLGADFQIRFQQDDNTPLLSDGRGYDEIRIIRNPRRDLYAFRLEAGETAALAVSGDARGLAIDLLDGRGQIVAEGLGAADPIVNGSFETGDYTGWAAETPGGDFIHWWLTSGGYGGELGLAPTAPQDGNFVAWNRFDGNGPVHYVLSQSLILPADAEHIALHWRDRIQWSFERGNFASRPRLYRVEVRDPDSNAVLETLLSFSTGTQDTNIHGDTGWQTRTADLSAYAGSAIRLVFVEDVPQAFTGLGQVEIDDVRVGFADFPANVDDLIAHFEAPASGIYFASVTGHGDGDYRLLVTRNADFDLESNDRSDEAQVVIAPQVAGRRWILGHASSSDRLLGASREGNLFEINPRNAITRLIGTLPSGSSTEIEYDPSTGRAFSQFRGGSFAGQEFDAETGTGLGGIIPNGASFNGLEYVGSTLYGTAVTTPRGASTLRVLDPITGASTIIGVTGVGPISGLAHDAATDILYGIAGMHGHSELYEIDRTTGIATPIGSTGFQAGSLEFGPDGALYGGGTGISAGRLFRIERGTGASTFVGATGFSGITGLLLQSALQSGDLYQIELGANEPVVLRTYTPAGASGAFANDVDPSLWLYGADGNLLAEDHDSAPDGRNARLKFHSGKSGAGTYFVEVGLSDPQGVGGEYLLSIK